MNRCCKLFWGGIIFLSAYTFAYGQVSATQGLIRIITKDRQTIIASETTIVDTTAYYLTYLSSEKGFIPLKNVGYIEQCTGDHGLEYGVGFAAIGSVIGAVIGKAYPKEEVVKTKNGKAITNTFNEGPMILLTLLGGGIGYLIGNNIGSWERVYESPKQASSPVSISICRGPVFSNAGAVNIRIGF